MATYQVETYCGTVWGWAPVSSAAPLSLADAERRLRLYRGVRGDLRLYRISAL
jgi:hypothetical protein